MVIKPIFRHFLLQLPNFIHISIIFDLGEFSFKEPHLVLSGSSDSLLNLETILVDVPNNFLLHGFILVELLCESLVECIDGLLLLHNSLVESLVMRVKCFDFVVQECNLIGQS